MLLSFVLEMDNADALADVGGLLESFDSVLGSCRRVRDGVEAPEMELAIVVGQHPHLLVNELLLPRAAAAGVFSRIVVVFAPATTYYEKKMLGAIHSRGDFVQFIDSDVTYAEPWLGMMLQAVADGACDVAYGCTYARLGSPEENATALSWQFAINDPRDHRYTTSGMRWSNNWIVRRDYLLAHPIPRVSGDLKLEGSFWDAFVAQQGVRLRYVATEAVHAQPTAVLELAKLLYRSGRGAVVGTRKDGGSLATLVTRWLRHNGLRTVLVRTRALRTSAPAPLQFSTARVLCLLVTSQIAFGVGMAREAAHTPRPVSFDYSALRSVVHLV